jgi:hypothetical protein
MVSWKDQQTGR